MGSNYLNDDEHVIDADAEQQERDGGMNRPVKDAHVKAESVRRQNRLADDRHADDRQNQLQTPIDS